MRVKAFKLSYKVAVGGFFLLSFEVCLVFVILQYFLLTNQTYKLNKIEQQLSSIDSRLNISDSSTQKTLATIALLKSAIGENIEAFNYASLSHIPTTANRKRKIAKALQDAQMLRSPALQVDSNEELPTVEEKVESEFKKLNDLKEEKLPSLSENSPEIISTAPKNNYVSNLDVGSKIDLNSDFENDFKTFSTTPEKFSFETEAKMDTNLPKSSFPDFPDTNPSEEELSSPEEQSTDLLKETEENYRSNLETGSRITIATSEETSPVEGDDDSKDATNLVYEESIPSPSLENEETVSSNSPVEAENESQNLNSLVDETPNVENEATVSNNLPEIISSGDLQKEPENLKNIPETEAGSSLALEAEEKILNNDQEEKFSLNPGTDGHAVFDIKSQNNPDSDGDTKLKTDLQDKEAVESGSGIRPAN